MTDERQRKPGHRIPPKNTNRARDLRKEAPVPERLLWSRLRGGQLDGIRFRRQHVMGPYVLDFYCAGKKLAIELDGRSHEDSAEHDARRTAYLESGELRVIRFSDDEVLRDLEAVVRRIAFEVGLE